VKLTSPVVPAKAQVKKYAEILIAVFGLAYSCAYAFDHEHTTWNRLLQKHLVVSNASVASRVNYAAFAQDRPTLSAYLAQISSVARSDYDAWSKGQRLAFLINAYNAYTVELVLRSYPDLRSIRDVGGVFGGPWKMKFFTLLGKPQSLDGIEHDTLRKPGAFDEPRIHFAVNCASIGCPMLREETYVAERVEAQLEEQTRRFLSDRSRNRYNAERGVLEVSSLFKWYRQDFERAGSGSLERAFARYADLLADDEPHRAAIRSGTVPIRFLDYDWALNDVRAR